MSMPTKKDEIVRLYKRFVEEGNSPYDHWGFLFYLRKHGVEIHENPPSRIDILKESTAIYDDGVLVIKRLPTFPTSFGIYLRHPDGTLWVVGYY